MGPISDIILCESGSALCFCTTYEEFEVFYHLKCRCCMLRGSHVQLVIFYVLV